MGSLPWERNEECAATLSLGACMHRHVPLSCHPLSAPPPPVICHPFHPGGAQGLRNTQILPVAESAEHRHSVSTRRAARPAQPLLDTENPPRHPKPIPKLLLLLPASCTVTEPAAQLSLPFLSTPKRLLHQTPLLLSPKSHSGGVSSWCLSRALGCEHSPAKHPKPSYPGV